MLQGNSIRLIQTTSRRTMNIGENSYSELEEDNNKWGPATFHFSDSTLDTEGVVYDDSTCVMYYQAQTHGKAASIFEHHTAPIASVEWNPTDSSVFAAAGLDDQITIWDMSAEGSEGEFGSELGVPDKLLFIHQGQEDIKEIHWHKQLPGVIFSTAHSGFNVFRTISV